MNYIVFDLEWNQPEDGLKSSERELPFEIIEIGAVKLNDDFRLISKFNTLVKPQVYSEINWRIRKMLELKPGELDRGKPFKEAAESFLEWCGENFIFCTWGSQDLMEFQRNMAYHKMPPLGSEPISYYNVQKMYGAMTGNSSYSKGLEKAVDEIGLRKDVPFHRAYSDAYYTSKILARVPEDIRNKYTAYDLYHLPAGKKKQIHIEEDEKDVLISRPFPDPDSIMRDLDFTAVPCRQCGGKAVKQSLRWFTINHRVYNAVGKCREHGYIAAKIKIKKAEEGGFYAEKSWCEADEEEYERQRTAYKNAREREKKYK